MPNTEFQTKNDRQTDQQNSGQSGPDLNPMEGCQKAFVAEQVRFEDEDDACLDPVH